MSVDPGNAGADTIEPQSWNGYSYVGNNPLLYTDIDGKDYLICDTSGRCYERVSDSAFKKAETADSHRFVGDKKGGQIFDSENNLRGIYIYVPNNEPIGQGLSDAEKNFIRGLIISAGGAAIGIVAIGGGGSNAGFTAAEIAIAEVLRGYGRNVVHNPDEGVPDKGRQGDALVDGIKVEFKTISKQNADANTIVNTVNKSIRRGGQARQIVIDVRPSGMSESVATQGAIDAFNSSPRVRNRVDAIRVIGNDFSIVAGQNKDVITKTGPPKK